MAVVYDGFHMNAEKLLDSRQIVKNSDQLQLIDHPCEGLVVWSQDESTLFVYKEDRKKWIPIPVTIPTEVLYPINGSVKFNPDTLKLSVFYGGSWYSQQLVIEP